MKETIVQELTLFWEKLRYFALRLSEMPRSLIEDPSSVSKGDLAMMAVTALLIVGFLIGGVIRFLKAPWKKKGGMLLSTLLVILIVGTILFFSLRGVELPKAEEGERAESVVLGEEELPYSDRYSLCVGKWDSYYALYYNTWMLTDDVVTLPMEGGLVFQLSGIHSLPGTANFALDSIGMIDDMAGLALSRIDSGFRPPQGATEQIRDANDSEDSLGLLVMPEASLTDMAWYGEPGEELSDGDRSFIVLENDGESVLFIMEDPTWINSDGRLTAALCEGRQIGPDVIYAEASTEILSRGSGVTQLLLCDPREDETQLARLRELLDALLDSRVRVLRGLTEEELASLLPTRLVEASGGAATGNGSFSIPCTRLIGKNMRDEGLMQTLEWIGAGPEGESVRYLLRNAAWLYSGGEDEPFRSWRDAYEAGKKTPDEAMSAFIGCTAVAYEDGWLIQPGRFYLNRGNSMTDNYYYLTVEPAA